ncbi:hypothetical protein KGP24_00490 [Enterobacter sp. JBIWA008]|uniref:hypothetical protein n=1 Tax=Enterobacter sp. JBIWA008 TaxID=2831892 RepID=UPI001CBFE0BD|nr:hypothetical protein [Enterobacter sp. JBIWA008]UAN41012.1 hypothetical protein KGP24_00490 [Enterobacter sp. JBIWA008]
MIIGVDEAPAIALALLNEKLTDWQKTVPPSWPSTWPVFNRLVERHDEMVVVYREIASSSLSRQQLWVLLEQIIHAGSFGTDSRFAKLRADHQELAALNDNISTMSMQLAEMLERRSELSGNGHFHCERMLKLTEFIDDAGEGCGHYQLHLKPEMQRLNSFDLKYWPGIAGIIRSLGMEEVEVTFADEATEAIIKARRPSLTDFFRALFDNIGMQKTGDYYALPRTFKLSDSALATICNITRDLPPDELIDVAYVKRTRHRLKKQGFSAAW